MPPVSGHRTANHQAQRWIDSAVALKPMVQKCNREHVERIVEQIAVGDGEVVGPIEMREDSERNGLAEMSHQQRADEAQYQIEPDRRSKRP